MTSGAFPRIAQSNHARRGGWSLIVTFSFLVFPASLFGHEGHQPLPSKGVQVDTQTGRITLSAQARETLGVRSEEVTLGTVASSLQVYADTVAPWPAKAVGSAQLSGRISKLLVRPGDFVSANQVIAELSSRELETIKLEFLQSQKETALNNRLLEITRPTASAGAVPMQRLLDLENTLQQSVNRLEIARIRAATLGMNWNATNPDETLEVTHQIRSPIAGQIIHTDLSEGKYVEAFEHLFEIVNTETSWVRMQLLEKDAFRVAVGQPVKLQILNSKITFEGTVERIDASMDPQTQVIWAWMTVAHPEIVPGLVGRATIHTSTQNATLTVPQRAVYSDGLQSYVFVEEASTRNAAEYRKRIVKLGKRRLATNDMLHPRVEVEQGDIYPGDRVVVVGGHELSSLFFLGVLKLSDDEQKRLGIATIPVTPKPIARTVQLPATVTLPPEGRSIVSSQLDGTIRSHTLSPGREVHAGELLMEIASPEFHKLQLDLLTASLEASLARHRAERLEELKGDAVSLRVAIESRSQAEQWGGRAESLKRQLATIGLSHPEIDAIINERKVWDYLPLRSAIDGKISSTVSTLGETVVANQPLVEVQNLDSVWIEAHVAASESGSIRPGSKGIATMLSNPEISVPVIVTRTGPLVDASTRTQRIWLAPSPEAPALPLRSGMLVSVAISMGEGATTLAVPKSSLVRDGIHTFVFVKKENGYIERRRVETGRSDGLFTEILNGVREGEAVVTSGGRDLQTAYASLR